jgi:hypothetical protein
MKSICKATYFARLPILQGYLCQHGGFLQHPRTGTISEPSVTYQWRPGDFGAMAGDLLLSFDPSDGANASSKWPRPDQDLRRVKAVSAMLWGLARFAAGGRACCHFEPGNSRKPPLAGDFRSEFPDSVANFPASTMHCDDYVCLLQHLPERWPLGGNYDNFGIALV